MKRLAFVAPIKAAIPWIVLACILLFSTFQSYKLITMFKFVDEYNNWVPAGLMHQGKVLYKDIFFNRMPMPAYISYLLLWLVSPLADYYRIVQVHRLFMMVFSASWIIFLYWQFRQKWVVLFAASFELLKPYFFGFSFQAEAMLTYPLVYLYIMSISTKQFTKSSAIFGGICLWFILFLRETIVITALMIAAMLCLRVRVNKKLFYFAGTFILLTLITTLLIPQKEWLYQMITVNKMAFQQDIKSVSNLTGLWGSFTLPFQYVLLITNSNITHFQLLLALHCIIGMFLICVYCMHFGSRILINIKVLLYILVLLAASSLRVLAPEKEFWAIYRLIPWIGILIASICYFSDHLHTGARYLFYVVISSLIALYFCYPNSFLVKQIDRQGEYNISYFEDISYARAIAETTSVSDNVFVIGYASHIYILSHRKTSHPDSFYYPIHYDIPLYKKRALNMFANDPPVEVFVTDCNALSTQESIKGILDTKYVRLLKDKKPSCLYVKKDLATSAKAKLKSKGFD